MPNTDNRRVIGNYPVTGRLYLGQPKPDDNTRLIRNIITSIIDGCEIDEDTCDPRAQLIDFADLHDLDLNDIATLYRIAADMQQAETSLTEAPITRTLEF